MKNYTVKIKSTRGMQENYASEKQKDSNTSDASHASSPCMARCKNRIDRIFHTMHTVRSIAIKHLLCMEIAQVFVGVTRTEAHL